MTSLPMGRKVPDSAKLRDFTPHHSIYRLKLRGLTLQTMQVAYDPELVGDGDGSGAERMPLESILPVARAIYGELDVDQEHFVILACDHAGFIYGYKVVASGLRSEVHVDAHIVFRNALLLGAYGIVLMHNHPSALLVPSSDDLYLTRRLITLGRVLDIDVHDHIIFHPRTGALHLRPVHPELWPV